MDAEAQDIRAAQAGSEEAFARLIRLHQARLRGLVARWLHNPEDVYDIVQESLVTAWQRIGEIDPQQGLGPWLRTVCKRKALSFLRQQMRRKQVHDLGRVEAVLAERLEASLADDRYDDDVLEALRGCIEGLSAEHRQLLHRRYHTGEAVKAISKRQGRSPTAVSMVLNRLRRRLLECIGRQVELAS